MIEYKSANNKLLFATKTIPQNSGSFVEQVIIDNYSVNNSYFLELKCPRNKRFISKEIVFVDNIGEVELPNHIISVVGKVFVQLVIRAKSGETLEKSLFDREPLYIVDKSINAEDALDYGRENDCLAMLLDSKNEVVQFEKKLESKLENTEMLLNTQFNDVKQSINTSLQMFEDDINSKVSQDSYNSDKSSFTASLKDKVGMNEINALEQTLSSAIDSKVGVTELDAVKQDIASKVGSSELNAVKQSLNSAINTKASITSLDSVKKDVASKVGKSELNTVKQSLTNTINTKANSSDLSAVVKKADSNEKMLATHKTELSHKAQVELLFSAPNGALSATLSQQRIKYKILIVQIICNNKVISTIAPSTHAQVGFGSMGLTESPVPNDMYGCYMTFLNDTTIEVNTIGYIAGGMWNNRKGNKGYGIISVYGVK